MKKIIITACALTAMLAAGASAADFSARYNPEGYVEIIGDADADAGRSVTLFLTEEDKIGSDSLPSLAARTITGEGGAVSASLKIDKNSYSGKYYLFVGYDGADMSKSADSVIIFDTNSNAAKDAAARLNAAADARAFYAVLSDENTAASLGIDVQKQTDLEEIATLCFAIKRAENLTIDAANFTALYNYAAACVKINKGASFDSVMKTDAAVFGSTYDEYKGLENLADIDACAKAADFSKGRMTLSQLSVLAKVRKATIHTELRGIIEGNASELGISLDSGDWAKIPQSKRADVFSQMYAAAVAAVNVRDVKTAFDAAAKAVADSGTSSGGSGGSGGGGGGSSSSGGSGSVIYPDAPGANPSAVFSDIAGHFAEEAITALCQKGILSGYYDGSFRPSNGITRAEAARVIAAAFNVPPAAGEKFYDVDENHWCSGYIGALADAGVIYGADGYFSPDAPITRQDAAVMLGRILTRRGVALEGSSSFADAQDISGYAVESVCAMAAMGIISGDNGRFLPKNNITRGEMAVLVNKILTLYGGAV